MVERLLISLIGMSGSGKSYWSAKLQEQGFQRFCCDDLIEARLDDELKKLGYSGIHDVAKWMGQPYDEQYERTSKRYLDLEGEVMRQVLAEVEESDKGRSIIDTTGSAIYLEDDVLSRLSTRTRVVYLETPNTVKDEMYKLYIADPKPVIWGDSFFRKDGETNMEALGRCYPLLLGYRAEKYAKLAQVTFDYHALRDPSFTVNNFLDRIKVNI